MDSKALCSKINVLLKTHKSDVATSHTADDFATLFRSKVNNIRRATANAPLPVIADRSCSQLSVFDDVSAEEVSKIVTKAPTKHCCLDPAPTWLVKRLMLLLAEMLAKICNASLSVQCYAWTEYKFTCVCLCVCPSHFLSTRLQVRPLNGFSQLIA